SWKLLSCAGLNAFCSPAVTLHSMIFTAALTSVPPSSVKITPITAPVSNQPARSVSRIVSFRTPAIFPIRAASPFRCFIPLLSINMSKRCFRERSDRFLSRHSIRRNCSSEIIPAIVPPAWPSVEGVFTTSYARWFDMLGRPMVFSQETSAESKPEYCGPKLLAKPLDHARQLSQDVALRLNVGKQRTPNQFLRPRSAAANLRKAPAGDFL